MTLINTWAQTTSPSGGVERHAVVACDGCLPVRGTVGTVDEMRARGWRIDDLDTGPHRCPWCPRRTGRRPPRRRSRPARNPALPNLLVIGAGKCGTSSLHYYLGLHPEVHMSKIKELRFLQLPGALDDLDTYATFFDGDAPVRGESSPNYTQYPLVPGVAERAHAALPDARLIYLVRDPIERAVAHYCELRPRFLPLEESVGDPDGTHNRFIAPGRYATQLERYLRVFAAEQVLVIDQHDLLTNRATTLRRVFRFLGVDDKFTSPEFEAVWNARETKIELGRIGTTLHRSRLAEALRALPRGPREAFFRPARALTASTAESPTIGDELRERLRNHYRPEADRLRALTGQRFATWQV